MTRFAYGESQKRVKGRKALLSVIVFAIFIIVFVVGVNAMATGNIDRQEERLENALNRTITYCYAVEGVYPESLDYMKTKYGLTYDENHFFVDYHVSGANIRPDVTVIRKGE